MQLVRVEHKSVGLCDNLQKKNMPLHSYPPGFLTIINRNWSEATQEIQNQTLLGWEQTVGFPLLLLEGGEVANCSYVGENDGPLVQESPGGGLGGLPLRWVVCVRGMCLGSSRSGSWVFWSLYLVQNSPLHLYGYFSPIQFLCILFASGAAGIFCLWVQKHCSTATGPPPQPGSRI